MEIDLRRVEVMESGDWVEREMRLVRKGDVFRMFEPDGSPIVLSPRFGHSEERLEFIAGENAHEIFDANGDRKLWGVNLETPRGLIKDEDLDEAVLARKKRLQNIVPIGFAVEVVEHLDNFGGSPEVYLKVIKG